MFLVIDIEKEVKKRIEAAQLHLEGNLDQVETWLARGRIKAFREVLDFIKEQRGESNG